MSKIHIFGLLDCQIMTTNKQFQTEFQDNHAKTQELVEEYERINFGAPNIHSSYNILKVAFFLKMLQFWYNLPQYNSQWVTFASNSTQTSQNIYFLRKKNDGALHTLLF